MAAFDSEKDQFKQEFGKHKAVHALKLNSTFQLNPETECKNTRTREGWAVFKYRNRTNV